LDDEYADALSEMAEAVENAFRNGRVTALADELDRIIDWGVMDGPRADLYVYGDKVVVVAERDVHCMIEAVLVSQGLAGMAKDPVGPVLTPAPEYLALPGDSEANREVIAKIRKVIAKFEFDGIQFENAVQFLRDVSRISICVNWPALQAGSTSKEMPISLCLRDVTLAQVLHFTLDQIHVGRDLCFIVEEGVITISTREDIATKTHVKACDVSDITRQAGFTAGERRELRGLVERVLSAPPPGSAGPQPCSAPVQRTLRELCAGHPDDLVSAIEAAQARRRVTQLVSILNSMGDTGEWNNSLPARIMATGDKLLIQTDLLSHQAIAHFLAGLREMSRAK
jgi:hypothetical protein